MRSLSISSDEVCLTGEFYVPFSVVISCQAAVGLGTLVGEIRALAEETALANEA
jgi:hypothetical protein